MLYLGIILLLNNTNNETVPTCCIDNELTCCLQLSSLDPRCNLTRSRPTI